MKLCLMMLVMAAGMVLAAADQMFYVAPQAAGNGSGSDPANAAAIRNNAFWNSVNTALEESPVTVSLLEGNYQVDYPGKNGPIRISNLGNEKNRLTIAGKGKKTVFFRNPEDDRSTANSKNFVNLVTLFYCKNITFQDLYFTGEGIVGYGLQIRASKDILVRNSRWEKMPGVSYGASGANGRGVSSTEPAYCANITWENCYFNTVGYDSHAHMLYNANNCNNLVIRNCDFIDSTGDYIRFRNGGENILVENCRFLDTGTAPAKAYPFISVPIFNSRPGQNEVYAKKLTVRNCDFRYTKPQPRSVVILYHITGLNTEGKEYVFTKAESKAMSAMNFNDGRAFYLKRTGVDLADIVYENNKTKNIKDIMVHECWPRDKNKKPLPKSA